MSHPVRVRGLKLLSPGTMYTAQLSHPVRVRGLKPVSILMPALTCFVAPRAGAWVETYLSTHVPSKSHVAPRAGAWVETCIRYHSITPGQSHPVRVRGLKQSNQKSLAPKIFPSHPVRVRGLKHIQDGKLVRIEVSHPVRVRGLKR